MRDRPITGTTRLAGSQHGRARDRYHELGVQELVRFDGEAPPGERLRIWDRVDENLLERVVEGDRSPSEVIDAWWVVVDDEALGPVLRPVRSVGTRSLARPDGARSPRARARATCLGAGTVQGVALWEVRRPRRLLV